jgi:adenylate cyclase
MGLEIERKFLIDHEKWGKVTKPEACNLKQGYILSEERKTIRIRVDDEQAYITIKGATLGITRSEFEYIIPHKDGVELLQQFAVSYIEKARYCITVGNKVWEVDVFGGDNAGLIVAEIELDHEDEQFLLPEWVADEVTRDERYYNSNLSVHPYKNW